MSLKCKGSDAKVCSVDWLFIQNAYVPVITVCTEELNTESRVCPVPSPPVVIPNVTNFVLNATELVGHLSWSSSHYYTYVEFKIGSGNWTAMPIISPGIGVYTFDFGNAGAVSGNTVYVRLKFWDGGSNYSPDSNEQSTTVTTTGSGNTVQNFDITSDLNCPNFSGQLAWDLLPGTQITIQYRINAGAWITLHDDIDGGNLGETGTYNFSFEPADAGDYEFQAFRPSGTPSILTGYHVPYEDLTPSEFSASQSDDERVDFSFSPSSYTANIEYSYNQDDWTPIGFEINSCYANEQFLVHDNEGPNGNLLYGETYYFRLLYNTPGATYAYTDLLIENVPAMKELGLAQVDSFSMHIYWQVQPNLEVKYTISVNGTPQYFDVTTSLGANEVLNIPITANPGDTVEVTAKYRIVVEDNEIQGISDTRTETWS